MNKKFICLLLVAILVTSALCVFAACDTTRGNEPPLENTTRPDDDGGMNMDQAIAGNGMRLSAVKIPRPLFAEEGINPLAESAQQLTATITPADAVNKEVDWSVAWNNASSTWAKGKTVTDYVTVTPTADGALTANLSCLQAFAEKIVVTVSVRSDAGIYATATVDYEKRILGFDFSIGQTWEANEIEGQKLSDPVQWTMTTANLSPTVDFPRMYSILSGTNTFQQNWIMGYDVADTTAITINPHYSIYTVDKSYDSVYVSVAPTAEYITALKAAGLTVTATAGQFVEVWADSYDQSVSFSLVDLMMDAFVSNSNNFAYFDNYTAMRSSLRSNVTKTMLQVKIQFGSDSRDAVTVYNLKFSAESVTPLTESITLNPGSIKF